MKDMRTWLEQTIVRFVEDSPHNSFGEGERIWGTPLVGFADGNDSYFEFFKQDIGSFYLLPHELIRKEYVDAPEDEAVSVVSWVLPQAKTTKAENAAMGVYPSQSWVRARIDGEEFNRKLAAHIVSELHRQGLRAVAPMLSPFFSMQTSDKYGYAATWSERHTAFVAGLGTFGLCDGLITARGKAMRCGSVIVYLQLPPTPRPYSTHNDYCLYFSGGNCFACAERCPVSAIGPNGHDKKKCREYQQKVLRPYIKDEYALESSCCGLCQTGVPCESSIPKN